MELVTGVILLMVFIGGLYLNIQSFFYKNARMGLAVKSYEKMDADKKTRLFNAANDFIKKVTV